MSNYQVFALVVLFGGLFYVWYLVKSKRGFGDWLTKQVGQKEIKVIETASIGMRVSLTLVDVKGKNFLVLVAPQGVQIERVDSQES